VARYFAAPTSPERACPSNRSTRGARPLSSRTKKPRLWRYAAKPSFAGVGQTDGGVASLVDELFSCGADGSVALHPGFLPQPDVAPISGWYRAPVPSRGAVSFGVDNNHLNSTIWRMAFPSASSSIASLIPSRAMTDDASFSTGSLPSRHIWA
jgi:hypothetical protein